MNRIVVLGMVVLVGAILGCSGGGSPEAQPKNANADAKSRVAPGGNSGPGAAKATPAIKD